MALERSIQKRAIGKRRLWNNLPGNKHNIWVRTDARKKEGALRETSTSIGFPLVREEEF